MYTETILLVLFVGMFAFIILAKKTADADCLWNVQYAKFDSIIKEIEGWQKDHPYQTLPHYDIQEKINIAYAYACWLDNSFPEKARKNLIIKNVLTNFFEYIDTPPQKPHS